MCVVSKCTQRLLDGGGVNTLNTFKIGLKSK